MRNAIVAALQTFCERFDIDYIDVEQDDVDACEEAARAASPATGTTEADPLRAEYARCMGVEVLARHDWNIAYEKQGGGRPLPSFEAIDAAVAATTDAWKALSDRDRALLAAEPRDNAAPAGGG